MNGNALTQKDGIRNLSDLSRIAKPLPKRNIISNIPIIVKFIYNSTIKEKPLPNPCFAISGKYLLAYHWVAEKPSPPIKLG